MLRRKLLAAAALIPVAALGLAACNGTTVATISAAVASDASLVGKGLLGILSDVASAVGITPATLTAVSNDFTGIETAAVQIVSGIAAAVAAPSVTTIGNLLSDAITQLAGLSLPTSITSVLSAAQTLLPILEAAAGIAIAVGAAPTAMTPAQARVVLAASAVH